MVGIEIGSKGTWINGRKSSEICVHDLWMKEKPYLEFEISNKPDAMYVGGFNLFGKSYGDYAQDIVMGIEYFE